MYVLALSACVLMVILIHLLYHRQKRGMIYIMVVHYEGELTGDEVLRAMKKIKYQMKSKTLRGSLTEMMLEVYCRTAVSYTHLIDIGCAPERCRVIPNGIHYKRFCDIPLKEEDGWTDIGAVVRLAPIKDIKTLIYSFYELKFRLEKVRLHIIGPEDDKQYAQECYELVRQLGVKDVLFPGMVNVLEYMKKLDFTVLTSISEGQPLSVLESFAAGRPCVTTDVGCCRELLNGMEGDELGSAGFCVPPMDREALCSAMERMCPVSYTHLWTKW